LLGPVQCVVQVKRYGHSASILSLGSPVGAALTPPDKWHLRRHNGHK
jgi:hypothetical protein